MNQQGDDIFILVNRSDLASLRAEVERLKQDNATLQTDRDRNRALFEMLANDALCALAGKVGTPEEGYKKAPYLLKGDIQRLVRDRDELKSRIETLTKRLEWVKDYCAADEDWDCDFLVQKIDESLKKGGDET